MSDKKRNEIIRGVNFGLTLIITPNIWKLFYDTPITAELNTVQIWTKFMLFQLGVAKTIGFEQKYFKYMKEEPMLSAIKFAASNYSCSVDLLISEIKSNCNILRLDTGGFLEAYSDIFGRASNRYAFSVILVYTIVNYLKQEFVKGVNITTEQIDAAIIPCVNHADEESGKDIEKLMRLSGDYLDKGVLNGYAKSLRDFFEEVRNGYVPST